MGTISFIPHKASKLDLSDCRMLYLEMEFHTVTFSDVLDSAIMYVRAIDDFQSGQFVTDWSVNSHHIKAAALEQTILQCKDKLAIFAEGVVKSSTIATLSSMRKHYKQFQLDPFVPKPSFFSADFPDRFQTGITPYIGDDSSLKKAIFDLFQENGKRFLGNRSWLDSGSLFVAYKHSRKTCPVMYRGKIVYYISVDSCGGFLDEAAEALGAILLRFGNMLKTANGRIGIGPWAAVDWSPYMTYFGGGYENVDGSHLAAEFPPEEWYPYYYICGIEWMNYLSSLPANRINCDIQKTIGVVSNCENGGMVIKLHQPISKVEPGDLTQIKHIMSPVLFPGKSVFDMKKYLTKPFSYSWLPRRCWEIVPISIDDIHVKDSVVTFFHNPVVDATINQAQRTHGNVPFVQSGLGGSPL